MISSPILFVGRSRSGDSCTYFSTPLTMLSSFDGGTGRFSHARRIPAITLLRSNVSRRPSFLMTMYGIWSIRSYEVKRRSHFKHSRLRRIASPSRDSRESTTLSSRKPQKGHFITFYPHSRFSCPLDLDYHHPPLANATFSSSTACSTASAEISDRS